MEESSVSISETQQGSLLQYCALPLNTGIKERFFGFQFICISFAIFLDLHSFVFCHETDHAVRAAGHEGAGGPRGVLVIVLGRQPLAVLLIVLVT